MIRFKEIMDIDDYEESSLWYDDEERDEYFSLVGRVLRGDATAEEELIQLMRTDTMLSKNIRKELRKSYGSKVKCYRGIHFRPHDDLVDYIKVVLKKDPYNLDPNSQLKPIVENAKELEKLWFMTINKPFTMKAIKTLSHWSTNMETAVKFASIPGEYNIVLKAEVSTNQMVFAKDLIDENVARESDLEDDFSNHYWGSEDEVMAMDDIKGCVIIKKTNRLDEA